MQTVGPQKHVWMLMHVSLKVDILNEVSAVVLTIFNAVHGKIIIIIDFTID